MFVSKITRRTVGHTSITPHSFKYDAKAPHFFFPALYQAQEGNEWNNQIWPLQTLQACKALQTTQDLCLVAQGLAWHLLFNYTSHLLPETGRLIPVSLRCDLAQPFSCSCVSQDPRFTTALLSRCCYRSTCLPNSHLQTFLQESTNSTERSRTHTKNL